MRLIPCQPLGPLGTFRAPHFDCPVQVAHIVFVVFSGIWKICTPPPTSYIHIQGCGCPHDNSSIRSNTVKMAQLCGTCPCCREPRTVSMTKLQGLLTASDEKLKLPWRSTSHPVCGLGCRIRRGGCSEAFGQIFFLHRTGGRG